MIAHIVLFKLREATDASVAETVAMLKSMEGKVPMLRHLEVGADVIRSERSYDVALYSRFDSREDLAAYQVDTYHAGTVVPYMKSVCSAIVAADYEL